MDEFYPVLDVRAPARKTNALQAVGTSCDPESTYATMYGMQRTTVYLPDQLKLGLKRAARAAGRSEADLIREGVEQVVAAHGSVRPRIPLFRSEDPTLAENVEESLEGFGER